MLPAPQSQQPPSAAASPWGFTCACALRSRLGPVASADEAGYCTKPTALGGSSLGAATLAAADWHRRDRIPAPRCLVTAHAHKEQLILRQSPATLRRAARAGALSCRQARTRCPALLQQPPNKILPGMGPLGPADAFRRCCHQDGVGEGPALMSRLDWSIFVLYRACSWERWGLEPGAFPGTLARAESTQELLPAGGAAEGKGSRTARP